MRFYTNTHAHYCGIDLHAKTMYLCILDRDGQSQLNFEWTSEFLGHGVAARLPDRCLVQAEGRPEPKSEARRSDALEASA